MAENTWRQKSRMSWMKLGDRNTRLFQIIANNRYHINMIGVVKSEGRMVKEPSQIKNAAVLYFPNVFKEERASRSTLGDAFPRTLSTDLSQELERMFGKEEMIAAIKDCSSLKAPGADGSISHLATHEA